MSWTAVIIAVIALVVFGDELSALWNDANEGVVQAPAAVAADGAPAAADRTCAWEGDEITVIVVNEEAAPIRYRLEVLFADGRQVLQERWRYPADGPAFVLDPGSQREEAFPAIGPAPRDGWCHARMVDRETW